MPNITVNVPALEKLLDYTASGIGSIAGSMLAPWKARQEAKALAEQSQGQANAIQIIEGARNRARNELISQPYSARWEIDVGSSISQRIQYQEEKRQRNIESVVRQAAEELEDKSVPDEEPDHDWTARFFNEVQDVSSEDMQLLWAKILAGEVEHLGNTSLHTLSVLRHMTQYDAELFSKFCSFVWEFDLPRPLIYDTEAEIYNQYNITYGRLIDLESLGLIKLVDVANLGIRKQPKSVSANYHGRELTITMPNESNNLLEIGCASLTSVGLDLLYVCDFGPVDGFFDYICERFAAMNLGLEVGE